MNSTHLAHLLDGCRQHDRASQSEVYQLFYRYALTVAMRYAGSTDAAREVVNDAFLRAFTKIENYDAAQPFKPWFNRIVVRSAIDYYRKYTEKRPPHDEIPDYSPLHDARDTTSVFEKMATEELLKLIQKLPPAYRTTMCLFAVEGYEHHEIAALLGVTEGTSKSNLFKARARLRDLIARREPNRIRS